MKCQQVDSMALLDELGSNEAYKVVRCIVVVGQSVGPTKCESHLQLRGQTRRIGRWVRDDLGLLGHVDRACRRRSRV